MLQLFSKNHFLYSLLFFPFIIVLHIGAFIREEVYTISVNTGGYFGEVLVEWSHASPVWGVLLNCFLVFLQITMLNRIVVINRLSNKLTLYPGMVYMVLTMLFPEFLVFSPAILAASFLILAVTYLLRSFKIVNAQDVFNTGFWIAVASICYTSLFIFFIWGMISFYILRKFRSVEILRYVIGFIVPYIWVIAGVFIWGNLSDFFSVHIVQQIGLPVMDFNDPVGLYVPLVVFGLLMLYTLLNYSRIIKGKTMQSKRKIYIFLWFIIAFCFSTVFTKSLDLTHLIFLAIPLSYFISESIVLMENKAIGELLMWIFVLIGVIFQYGIFT